MAFATHVQNRVQLLDHIVHVFGTIDGQHQRQLFVDELAVSIRRAFFDHEELMPLGLVAEAEHVGQDVRVFGDDVAVQMPVDPQVLADFFFFLGRAQIAAGALQRVHGLVVDAVQNDQRVFRRT